MTPQQLTGSDLREAVFEIISRELGPAALVRYIAENFSQPGRDYTADRAAQPQPTAEELAAAIASLKGERGGSLAPKGARVIRGEAKSSKPAMEE